MKIFIVFMMLTFSFSIFAIVQGYKWSVKSNIKTPESAYYAVDYNLVFVSSIDGEGSKKDGKGHISILSSAGKILNENWITGLNAPKGMRSLNGKLWVSDIDELVEIDMNKGKVLKKYPIKGAKFLNDIAISASGEVYVSDTITSKIYLLKNDKISSFVEGPELESPNGLLILDNYLYVAAWGLTTD